MESDTTQRNGVLSILLEKMVDDIFNSSCSDSSVENDNSSDDIDESPVSPEFQEVLKSEIPHTRAEKRKRKSVRFLFSLPLHTPIEFKERFGVSPETFEFILELIGHDLTHGLCGAAPMPPQLQLMIALRKMSSTESYRKICESFHVGKTSSLRAVSRVIQALFSHSSRYIVWPKDKRIQEICSGFERRSGVPKVIGALDSTYINIPEQTSVCSVPNVPVDQHSVQLQAVVDHEGRFIHCSIGTAGLIEKQEMFNNSAVCDYLSDSSDGFPHYCHLVAGSDYDLHERIMTPYSGLDLTEEQEYFNERLNLALRASVSHAFSALRGRFAGLRHKLDMFRKDLIPIFIMAACVLHNICLDRKDLHGGPIIIPGAKTIPTPPREDVAVPSARALEKRDALCRQMYLAKTEGSFFV